MKYLREFENHSQYEAFTGTSEFMLPNVSKCIQENDVHYNPYVDPYAGHEYVEIGGLKWATMNVGANSVTDTGLYFQWGDTQGYTASQCGSGEGQKDFGWADYKYNPSGDGSTMTKYNASDGKAVLDLCDDAARANWGSSWRIPTLAEFQALSAATTNAWTSITDGNVTVSGRQFTDKTDSSKTLFFPAAGRCRDGSVDDVGSDGYYWSSSVNTSGVVYGRNLYFDSGSRYMDTLSRRYGFPVRGVVG